MNIKCEVVTINPDSLSLEASRATHEVDDGTTPDATSNETKPSAFQDVSSQVDAWVKNNAVEDNQAETRYISNQISWFFWLREKRLLEMWQRTTNKARSK